MRVCACVLSELKEHLFYGEQSFCKKHMDVNVNANVVNVGDNVLLVLTKNVKI